MPSSDPEIAGHILIIFVQYILKKYIKTIASQTKKLGKRWNVVL